MDIIENKYGLSNEIMLEQCRALHNIMFKKIDVKTGRGRNVKVVKEFKYKCDGDDEVRAKIERSINWYSVP